eukprot:s4588_g1.t1
MPAGDVPPTLCLDSSGAWTVLGGKHDGRTIYNDKASPPGAYALVQHHYGDSVAVASCVGAYALVQLWQHHYGEDSVAVASSVNYIPTGGRVRWVARHAESVGILPERVYLVTNIEDKRRMTSRIKATVVIDDCPDALLWQARNAQQAGSLTTKGRRLLQKNEERTTEDEDDDEKKQPGKERKRTEASKTKEDKDLFKRFRRPEVNAMRGSRSVCLCIRTSSYWPQQGYYPAPAAFIGGDR